MDTKTKVCTNCKIEKPESEFRNRGLGLLGDSEENLERALKYLKKNGSYG